MDSENLNDSLKESIQMIRDSGLRMNELINDVLELISTKGSLQDPQKIRLADILREIVLLHKSKTSKEVNIEIEKIPEFLGHKILINSIFRNLIGNSFKYNENKVVNLWINYVKTDYGHKILVRDNGIGIPEDKKDQIFQPFVRVHTDKKYQGTGIGLAIVLSSIQKMNGKIAVEKTGADGTTIAVEFLDLAPA